MKEKAVWIDKEGPLWIVNLHRPRHRNAVDRDTARALVDAFEGFETNNDAKVAILFGVGGHFCAGADLKAVAEGRPNRLDPEGHGPMGPSRMALKKPVIAAIEGSAMAGGLELALWCDLRVAGEGAIFSVACRRWGVPLIDGGTVRLPRTIGMGRALDLILTGREVDSAEALSMGLITQRAPEGQALARAKALGRRVASFPQACMLADRQSTYGQWNLSEAEAIAEEFAGGMEVIESGETLRGARQFRGGAGRHGEWDLP